MNCDIISEVVFFINSSNEEDASSNNHTSEKNEYLTCETIDGKKLNGSEIHLAKINIFLKNKSILAVLDKTVYHLESVKVGNSYIIAKNKLFDSKSNPISQIDNPEIISNLILQFNYTGYRLDDLIQNIYSKFQTIPVSTTITNKYDHFRVNSLSYSSERYAIFTCSNRLLIDPILVLVSSIKKNVSKPFDFWILESDYTITDYKLIQEFSKELQIDIKCIKVNSEQFVGFNTSRWPLAAYYYLMAHDYLPQDLDRALYLDPDTIVLKDISNLYNSDFEDCIVIACNEHSCSLDHSIEEPQKYTYYNSGVVLLNLLKLRQEKYTISNYLEPVKLNKLGGDLADQAVLNYAFWNRSKLYPRAYYNSFAVDHLYDTLQLMTTFTTCECYQWYKERLADLGTIIHYGGKDSIKPWDYPYVEYNDGTNSINDSLAPQQNNLLALWWSYAKINTAVYSRLKLRNKQLSRLGDYSLTISDIMNLGVVDNNAVYYQIIEKEGTKSEISEELIKLIPDGSMKQNFLNQIYSKTKLLKNTILPSKAECTGCGACIQVCNHKAISLCEETDGFKYPTINKKLCVSCKKCSNNCPVLNPNYLNNYPKCYVAISSDEDLRLKSSSGGIFGTLAKYVLRQGGKVCGAAFNENLEASHVIIENEKELDKLLMSKYIQSDISQALADLNKIKDSVPVVFCGCPCQVAAVKQLFPKKNLLCCDFICHGVPSPGIFQRYLREEHVKKIRNIEFRNKSQGWSSNLLMKVEYVDGTTKYIPAKEDVFFRDCFLNNFALRNSCFECKFNKLPRQGDLTLADYWGTPQEYNDTKGTGLVFVNTKKGEEYFNNIQQFLKLSKEQKIENASKANRNLTSSTARPKQYSRFFDEITKSRSIKKTAYDVSTLHYDVGLVLYTSRNYGNSLTNYSLYRAIKKLGYNILLLPKSGSMSTLFEKYPYKDYEQVPWSLDEVNKHCTQFVLGSDQTLAPWCMGDTFYTCMSWVNEEKPKTIYGSSFGHNNFNATREYTSKAKYYLSRIDHISLREEHAVKLMKNTFNLNSDYVLDPVFLTDEKEYRELYSSSLEKIPKSPYLFAYILDPFPEKLEDVKKVAENKCVSNIILVIDSGKEYNVEGFEVRSSTKIEEFLALIDNSEYFVTDSFHGACLGLIFNKQFYFTHITPSRGLARISSLIDTYGLESRWILGNTPDNRNIDYRLVNKKLKKEREQSINWLNAALSDGQTVVKAFNPLEEITRKLAAQTNSITKLNEKISALSNFMKLNIQEEVSTLYECTTIGTYLQTIPSSCMVLVSICDEGSKNWNLVKDLIPTDLMFRESMAGALCNGEWTINKNNGLSTYHNVLADMEIYVESKSFLNETDKGYSLFRINHNNIRIEKRGLNIVVYSLKSKMILDLINVDLHGETSGKIHREI